MIYQAMSLKEELPKIYTQLIPQSVLNHHLSETKAQCSQCNMAQPDKRRRFHYQNDLKCCTYYPFTPNYIIGEVLQNYETSISADKFKNMIRLREFALPIGLVASGEYQKKFSERLPDDFGNDRKLLCPYFDKLNNQCSIWEFRGSVCRGYFCKSSYSRTGLKYWELFKEYFGHIEMVVAEELISELGYSPKDVTAQIELLQIYEFENQIHNQRTLSESQQKNYWSQYYLQEIEFYKNCYLELQKWNRKKFQEVIGDRGAFLQEELIETYIKLN